MTGLLNIIYYRKNGCIANFRSLLSVVLSLCCGLLLISGASSCCAQQKQSAGTGFAINSDGYFCTCYHVVSETTSITAILHSPSGKKVSCRAEIITVDASNDIAIIKLMVKTAKPIPIFTDKASVGQDALVIGYPLLIPLGQSAKMTKGLVSGFVSSFLQIDAPINPGNSGCPVVNQFGQCFGVASAKMSGPNVSNIGFCIPSEALVRLLDENGIAYEKATSANNSQLSPLTPAKVFDQVSGSLALILATKRPGASGTANITGPSEQTGPNSTGETSSQPRRTAGTQPGQSGLGVTGNPSAIPGQSNAPGSPLDFSQYPDGVILYRGQVSVPAEKVLKTPLEPGQVWIAPTKYQENKESAVPADQSDKERKAAEAKDPDSDLVQRAKEKLLKEYAAEIRLASTPMKKAMLNKKIFSEAQEEKKSFKKFVLFCIARDMAIESGDANITRRCTDEMVSGWDLDPFPANRSSLMAVGRNVKTPSQWEHLGNWSLDLAQMAIERDEVKLASQLKKIIPIAVQKAGARDLTLASALPLKRLDYLLEVNKQISESRSKWSENPDDPAVCRELGLYRCFVNNDFVQGLALLIKGDDEELKSVAEKELQGLKKISRRLEAGDLWWAISQKTNSPYKESMQARALFHYNKIIGTQNARSLEEDQRRQITKRLSPNRDLIQSYGDWFDASEQQLASDLKQKKNVADSSENQDFSAESDNSPEGSVYRYIHEQFRLKRFNKSPLAGNTTTGSLYTSVLKEGGLLVGLEISFNDSMGISSLTPLFQDKPGLSEVRGATIGYQGSRIAKVIASPGYAICGLKIIGSTGIEGLGGIQILCGPIGERGLGHDELLVSSFTGRGRVEQASTFSSNGGFIVGLQGQMSDPGIRQLLALGIVTVPPIPEPEANTETEQQ